MLPVSHVASKQGIDKRYIYILHRHWLTDQTPRRSKITKKGECGDRKASCISLLIIRLKYHKNVVIAKLMLVSKNKSAFIGSNCLAKEANRGLILSGLTSY